MESLALVIRRTTTKAGLREQQHHHHRQPAAVFLLRSGEVDPNDTRTLATGDPRSIESIEPSGIPDRSIRVDRALGDPRSIKSIRSSPK